METALIVVIAVAVLLIGVVVISTRRRRAAHQREELHYEAENRRQLADVTRLDAERRAAEADELEARARKDQVAARQQRLEAMDDADRAGSLRQSADELDPDPDDYTRAINLTDDHTPR